MEDFINSICGDSTLIDMDPDDSIDTALEKCKPFLDEYKITSNINNFTITNIKEYLLNKNKLHENKFIKHKDLWFGNKDLFKINFELKKYHLKN